MDIETTNRVLVDGLRELIPDPLNRGEQWIWYGFPQKRVRYPGMAVFLNSSAAFVREIGSWEHRHTLYYEVQIVTDSNASFTIGSTFYKGYKVVTYLMDRVIEAIETRLDWFRQRGINDIKLSRVGLVNYDPELDLYSGSVFLDVSIKE